MACWVSNEYCQAGDRETGSGAQVGVPTTTVPIRLGASNSSGTAGNFFAGSIKKLVVIPDYIDFATYLKIRAALLL